MSMSKFKIGDTVKTKAIPHGDVTAETCPIGSIGNVISISDITGNLQVDFGAYKWYCHDSILELVKKKEKKVDLKKGDKVRITAPIPGISRYPIGSTGVVMGIFPGTIRIKMDEDGREWSHNPPDLELVESAPTKKRGRKPIYNSYKVGDVVEITKPIPGGSSEYIGRSGTIIIDTPRIGESAGPNSMYLRVQFDNGVQYWVKPSEIKPISSVSDTPSTPVSKPPVFDEDSPIPFV